MVEKHIFNAIQIIVYQNVFTIFGDSIFVVWLVNGK